MNNTESDIPHIKEAIVRSFPDEIFSDMEFPGDEEWFDEDRDLYYMLKGRKWSEVPVDFIRANPSQIVLLDGAAFAAFFPAWLFEALENPLGKMWCVSL